MKKEIKFLIEMDRFTKYEGFSDLQINILLQDDIDERFKKNDFIDLVACILLYHQIIDNMLTSLIIQNKYIVKLNRYPKNIGEIKIPKNFAKKVEFLKKRQDILGCTHIRQFLIECRKINHLRNEVAHEFVKCKREDITYKLNKVKERYHYIQELYQFISTEAYNMLKDKIWNFEKYLRPSTYTDKDKEELRKYILQNYDEMNLFSNSIAMGIYIYLYKEEFDIKINNIDEFWDEVLHGRIQKEEILGLLHIK